MNIAGIYKTSLIDFPGNICTTIFTSGCNFRCPFCHNPKLAEGKIEEGSISTEDFIEFLKERKKLIDGVCITGGEPTLCEGLKDLCKKIKEVELLVKLDTNGTKPDIIKDLINEKLIDYVAMDIKSDKANYDIASGVKADIDKIDQTIKILKESNIKYEFRTTIVKDLYNGNIAKNIGEWLNGSDKYVLQQFTTDNEMINKDYQTKTPYTPDELRKFGKTLEPFFKKVEIRGI